MAIAYAVALDLADRVGCRLLTVDAYADSVAFYERLGFVANRAKPYQGRTHPSMRLDVFPDEPWAARSVVPAGGRGPEGRRAISAEGERGRHHHALRTARRARRDVGILGGTSWVNVRLAADGKKARFTLEHIAPKDGIGEEHMKKYGPGAVGVGWDLALHGLGLHFEDPMVPLDPAAFEAWTTSSEGKEFVRGCGEAWGAAHAPRPVRSPKIARGKRARRRRG